MLPVVVFRKVPFQHLFLVFGVFIFFISPELKPILCVINSLFELGLLKLLHH